MSHLLLGAAAPPLFANPHRACNTCLQQGIAMLNCARTPAVPLPGALPGAPPVIQWGTHVMFYGVAMPGYHLGVHRIGRLCNNCELIEIAAYHTRLYGGPRKPGTPGSAASNRAQAKAANTCLCQADLAKTYCYRDRRDMLNSIRLTSDENAGIGGWLECLQLNPVTGKSEIVVTDATLHTLRNRRAGVSESNACRCGADIPLAQAANIGPPPTLLPIPVAMCTACDGIIIDVNHGDVVGWAASGRQARIPTETNLRLNRNVPQV